MILERYVEFARPAASAPVHQVNRMAYGESTLFPSLLAMILRSGTSRMTAPSGCSLRAAPPDSLWIDHPGACVHELALVVVAIDLQDGCPALAR